MKKRVFALLLVMIAFYFNVQAQAGAADSFRVEASVPAFLYEGDHLEIVVKMTNKTASEHTGQVALQLIDAITNTSVDGWFQNVFPVQFFTVEPRATSEVSFPIEVPYLFKKPIHWRIALQGDSTMPQAEGSLQIFSLKKLITEKQAIHLQEGTHTYRFEKLVQSDAATEHQLFAVEFVANPVLQVASALPYSIVPSPKATPDVCSNYAAYVLASAIAKAGPVTSFLKQIKTDSGAQKPNQKEAQTTIASFFDATQLQQHVASSFEQLRGLQNSNGSFSWFANGPADAFITQVILSQLAQLQMLDAVPKNQQAGFLQIATSAFAYLDSAVADRFKQSKQLSRQKDFTASYLLPFFYTHALLKNIPRATAVDSIYTAFVRNLNQNTTQLSAAAQAMFALTLFQNGKQAEAKTLLQQLKQRVAKQPKPQGTLSEPAWPDATLQLTVQIEAFHTILNNTAMVARLQNALLNLKTYDGWQSPSATVAACAGLLVSSQNNTAMETSFEAHFGKTTVLNRLGDSNYGVLKNIFLPPILQPEMGVINVLVPQTVTERSASVNLYWRYFSDSASTKEKSLLTVKKEFFLVRGARLQHLGENETITLQVGDTLRTQISLTANRPLSYFHLKLPVAAGLQPNADTVYYLQQNKLAFYTVNEEDGQSFFIPKMPKGISVLTSDAVAAIKGTYTSGHVLVETFNHENGYAAGGITRVQID